MSIIPFDYQPPAEADSIVTRAQNPGPPDPVIQDAFDSAVVRVTRRLEIFESDGVTRWHPGDNRMVSGGNVSIDYNSAERRKIDVVLDNEDNALRPNVNGGLWYDKIVKTYMGCRYRSSDVVPRAAIIQKTTDRSGVELRNLLSSVGLTKTDILADIATDNEIRKYEYIIGYGGTGIVYKPTFLRSLWNEGKNIITISSGNTAGNIEMITQAGAFQSNSWGISPAPGDHAAAGGAFVSQGVGTADGRRVLGLAAGVTTLALWPASGGTRYPTAFMATSGQGGHWLHLQLPDFNYTQVFKLIGAVVAFMRNLFSTLEWETQTGEFMIDRLDDARFPNQVKVTGRDYSKKMMNSKLNRAGVFASGTSIRTILTAMAANSGIKASKMRIMVRDEVLTAEMSYEAGKDRWAIAKEVCDSFNYEIYFDQFGFFTVRPFLDPTTSATSFKFQTGYDNKDQANLIDFSKSINDSRIYNKVVVTSTPTGADTLPYYGEAANYDPASPTSIGRIGERTLFLDAPFLNSDAECKALAESRLKITALESYEINWTTRVYPWTEVGEIAEFLDPNRVPVEPTRYLLDTASIPFGMEPMTATGKRVTYVGSSGTPNG